jgi:hypothetical protein
MLSSTQSRRNYFNPSARGYHAVYHDGEVNHCPGCGRTHWLIGRDGVAAQGSDDPGPRADPRVLERHPPELRRAQRGVTIQQIS